MFLHAHHVAESQEYQAVVIVADELSNLDYQTHISMTMYQKSGTSRIEGLLIRIYLLSKCIDKIICDARTSLHAFTVLPRVVCGDVLYSKTQRCQNLWVMAG